MLRNKQHQCLTESGGCTLVFLFRFAVKHRSLICVHPNRHMLCAQCSVAKAGILSKSHSWLRLRNFLQGVLIWAAWSCIVLLYLFLSKISPIAFNGPDSTKYLKCTALHLDKTWYGKSFWGGIKNQLWKKQLEKLLESGKWKIAQRKCLKAL